MKLTYFSTPLPPLPTDKVEVHPNDQYCNTVGYGHLSAAEDDIYSKPVVN